MGRGVGRAVQLGYTRNPKLNPKSKTLLIQALLGCKEGGGGGGAMGRGRVGCSVRKASHS